MKKNKAERNFLDIIYQGNLLILLFAKFHVGLQVFFCELFLFLTLGTNCSPKPSYTLAETICKFVLWFINSKSKELH